MAGKKNQKVKLIRQKRGHNFTLPELLNIQLFKIAFMLDEAIAYEGKRNYDVAKEAFLQVRVGMIYFFNHITLS